MFLLTARLTRRKVIFFVLVLGLIAAALLLLSGRRESSVKVPQLLSNADRVSYLQSFGWQVAEEPVETLQLLFPEKLEEPYLSYNELQKTQGFDLTGCCGKQVARYTYTVRNYPGQAQGVQINLYVCEGVPAAGDVIASGADGFQAVLAYPANG